MAKIIVKSGYIKSISHLLNYLSYAGEKIESQTIIYTDGSFETQESDIIIDTTNKNINYIELRKKDGNIINISPDQYTAYIEKNLEKKDIKIMTFLDENGNILEQEFNPLVHIDYISYRPHVVKDEVLGHGLFGVNGAIDITTAKDTAIKYQDSIWWSHIVSITRNDAQRTGFDNKIAWQNLIRSKAIDICKIYNISFDNLLLNCAYHDKELNPHIHLFFASKDKREGFVKGGNDGLINASTKMRSIMFNQIFKEDVSYLKETKNAIEYDLKKQLNEYLQNIQSKEYSIDPSLIESFSRLSSKISNITGKKVYGFMPQDVKNDVNLLLKDIVTKDKYINKLFLSYLKLHSKFIDNYVLDDNVKAVKQNEFINKFFSPSKNDSKEYHNIIIKYAALLSQSEQAVKKEYDSNIPDSAEQHEYSYYAGQDEYTYYGDDIPPILDSNIPDSAEQHEYSYYGDDIPPILDSNIPDSAEQHEYSYYGDDIPPILDDDIPYSAEQHEYSYYADDIPPVSDSSFAEKDTTTSLNNDLLNKNLKEEIDWYNEHKKSLMNKMNRRILKISKNCDNIIRNKLDFIIKNTDDKVKYKDTSTEVQQSIDNLLVELFENDTILKSTFTSYNEVNDQLLKISNNTLTHKNKMYMFNDDFFKPKYKKNAPLHNTILYAVHKPARKKSTNNEQFALWYRQIKDTFFELDSARTIMFSINDYIDQSEVLSYDDFDPGQKKIFNKLAENLINQFSLFPDMNKFFLKNDYDKSIVFSFCSNLENTVIHKHLQDNKHYNLCKKQINNSLKTIFINPTSFGAKAYNNLTEIYNELIIDEKLTYFNQLTPSTRKSVLSTLKDLLEFDTDFSESFNLLLKEQEVLMSNFLKDDNLTKKYMKQIRDNIFYSDDMVTFQNSITFFAKNINKFKTLEWSKFVIPLCSNKKDFYKNIFRFLGENITINSSDIYIALKDLSCEIKKEEFTSQKELSFYELNENTQLSLSNLSREILNHPEIKDMYEIFKNEYINISHMKFNPSSKDTTNLLKVFDDKFISFVFSYSKNLDNHIISQLNYQERLRQRQELLRQRQEYYNKKNTIYAFKNLLCGLSYLLGANILKQNIPIKQNVKNKNISLSDNTSKIKFQKQRKNKWNNFRLDM